MIGKSHSGGGPRLNSPGNLRYAGSYKGTGGSHLDPPDETELNPDDASSVAILVVNDEGQILTISNRNRIGFNMPGGGVETGEMPREAAARELFEETGLKAHGLVPIYVGYGSNGRVVATYKALSYSGRLRSSEEGDVSWSEPEIVASSAFGRYFQDMQAAVGNIF